ncbi:MAG: phage tail tube protein [Candidatus Methanomethylicaceae archaeon]
MLSRRTVILAKVETNYGTDATPGTGNGIACTIPDLTPTGDILTRDFVRNSISPFGHAIGAKVVELSFDTELKGSGSNTSSAAVLPEIDPLLRICGMTPTFTSSGTNSWTATYKPVSTNFNSATIYVYRDGILHKITGCRGTFSLNLEAGNYGKISWTIRGLYQDPIDQSMISGVQYNTTVPPIVKNVQLTLDSYSPYVRAITFDLGNTLAERRDVNAAEALREITITSRTSQGTIDPEMDLLSVFNWYQKWSSASDILLQATQIGTTNGNKIQFKCPKIKLRDLRYDDRDGVLVLRAGFQAVGEDDEVQLVFM